MRIGFEEYWAYGISPFLTVSGSRGKYMNCVGVNCAGGRCHDVITVSCDSESSGSVKKWKI